MKNIHHYLNESLRAYNPNSGVSNIGQLFYTTPDSFYCDYISLLRKIRESCLEDFYFQKVPTVRFHCPQAKNSYICYPHYHSDWFLYHPPQEINVWIPLTPPSPSHGLRLMNHHESFNLIKEYDFDLKKADEASFFTSRFTQKCDQSSVDIKTTFGSTLLFDSRCIHSVIPLQTHTRVSIDIRIIPAEDFKRGIYSFQGLGKKRAIFEPGYAYHEQTIDTF